MKYRLNTAAIARELPRMIKASAPRYSDGTLLVRRYRNGRSSLAGEGVSAARPIRCGRHPAGNDKSKENAS